ncbi:MAG: hypothetical protein EVB03_01315 [SAR92 clade bacterium]|uniref:Uncharacterized protein n=1 Tax=SAR92 clade bacterium TaxID=2315479 RepID=A0A520MP82_9GAMM|nr:MAG: hypothetical protein EVB03_01315 [SAR92 clade bacterium]
MFLVSDNNTVDYFNNDIMTSSHLEISLDAGLNALPYLPDNEGLELVTKCIFNKQITLLKN